MIYKLDGNGLRRIDVPANGGKNNLPIGTVLQWEGHGNEREVVVKNLGVNPTFEGHGARYQCVNLGDGRFRLHDAFNLEWLTDKRDSRIAVYITAEIVPEDECLALWEKAAALEDLERRQKETAEQERQALIARGREIARAKGIEDAPAIIVAEDERDDCDLQTDYFNTVTAQLVVLATSRHRRDNFSEMRKAAARFDKTAHLATAPNINGNGEPKRADNADWWHPNDEHREKHSMGHGYYLKASSRYSSGWLVRKQRRWDAGKPWRDEVYISLAQVCVI